MQPRSTHAAGCEQVLVRSSRADSEVRTRPGLGIPTEHRGRMVGEPGKRSFSATSGSVASMSRIADSGESSATTSRRGPRAASWLGQSENQRSSMSCLPDMPGAFKLDARIVDGVSAPSMAVALAAAATGRAATALAAWTVAHQTSSFLDSRRMSSRGRCPVWSSRSRSAKRWSTWRSSRIRCRDLGALGRDRGPELVGDLSAPAVGAHRRELGGDGERQIELAEPDEQPKTLPIPLGVLGIGHRSLAGEGRSPSRS